MTVSSLFTRVPKAARWLLAALCSAGAAVCLGYYWRVFYYLDARGVPASVLTGCLCALAVLAVLAVYGVTRLKSTPGRGGAAIVLCGLVFVFASAPLQAPDEISHYLRAYAISEGHFDFDAERTYPQDVNRLVQAFPGAWVNAHTSKGVWTDPETGEEKVYDTSGHALKQQGSDGRVESPADSMALYLEGTGEAPAAKEPVLFMVPPFLPQALGMFVARLVGFGALGCLYAGRIANLLLYALICAAALRRCGRACPLFLAVMLCPLSLYMAASMSYDASLLACYYLMAALFVKGRFGKRECGLYLAAFCWVNMCKPWINLLWLALPLLAARGEWKAPVRKWMFAAGSVAAALGVTAAVEWYGVNMRVNYGTIGRMLEGVEQMPQLLFVLRNPLRFAAVLVGTLYENDFFLGKLGCFGSLDLPVGFVNVTGGAMLLLGAVLSVGKKPALNRPARLGALAWCVVYTAGCMAAMYITYTPVGMVRVIGLQSRYFMPVYLLGFWALAQGLNGLLCPQPARGTLRRTENTALAVFAAYAAVSGLLLFQHYFIGPVYTIG